MLKNKYFTPELTEEDRRTLLLNFRLDRLHFLFVESAGEVLIRVSECQNGVAKDLLNITTRLLLDGFCKEKAISTVEDRSIEAEAVVQQISGKSLWEAIFPFPFCKIGKNVRVSPASFETDLFRLERSFSNLEKKMAASEVGLLTIEGPIGTTQLLLHFVRGVRIRVGIAHDIEPFLSTFRGAVPTTSELEAYFGTSVAYARLDTFSILGDGDFRISDLVGAIDYSASSVICSLNHPGSNETVQQIQL